MTRITPILLLFACASALAGPELSKADVLAVVQEGMPDIQMCGSNDKVLVHWLIDTSGSVRNVKLDGKHAGDAVGRCVKRRVAELRFGPSLKEVPVTFPFKLGTNNGKSLPQKDVTALLKTFQGDLGPCGVGVVTAKFTVQPSGVLRGIRVEGEHKDDSVGQCVAGKLARIRFPTATAPTPVTFPFRIE